MFSYDQVNFIHFNTIDSTNTWAKTNADSLDPQKVTCITAEAQTAGRGRFRRKWVSPSEGNIYATFYFCISKDAPYFSNLSQLLSISFAKVLIEEGLSPQIKWPNDILLGEKKLAGILCESITLNDRLGIVLGIGVNVNMPEEVLSHIDQPAISLAVFTGKSWSVQLLLKEIVKQFLQDLSKLQSEGFSCFRAFYEQQLAFKGKEIECLHGTKTIQGICHSIAPNGNLNVQMPDGSLISVYSGEIHPSSSHGAGSGYIDSKKA